MNDRVLNVIVSGVIEKIISDRGTDIETALGISESKARSVGREWLENYFQSNTDPTKNISQQLYTFLIEYRIEGKK